MLPTQIVKASTKSPRKLFIFSAPKVGKTSLLAQLPNSLLLDFEDGSEYVDAMRINMVRKAAEANKPLLQYIREVADELGKSSHKYDYIILDTATALEDIAKELALILYRQTPMGKNYTDNNVLSLPNGAGYLFLREAFEKLYNLFKPHAKKCLVLAGHVKKASILKDGKELGARDVDLTGKLKQIVCSDADAIGYLYREKESNRNILSFKTSELDLSTGARPEHLRSQEFVISEFENGVIKSYWNKIFID